MGWLRRKNATADPEPREIGVGEVFALITAAKPQPHSDNVAFDSYNDGLETAMSYIHGRALAVFHDNPELARVLWDIRAKLSEMFIQKEDEEEDDGEAEDLRSDG